MWPVGHAAVAYLVYRGVRRWRGKAPPTDLAVGVVLVAALVPDLLDKPLAWYLGVLPTGRSMFHSLVVLVPLCLVVGLWWHRRGCQELTVAFAVGVLSHAIVDALPALWRPEAGWTFLVYPVVPIEGYESGAPTILGLFMDQVTTPWFHLEFVLALVAVYVWWREERPDQGST